METSINPCVLDTSGDFFRVLLMNTADRPLKSHVSWEHSPSCGGVSVATGLPFAGSARS